MQNGRLHTMLALLLAALLSAACTSDPPKAVAEEPERTGPSEREQIRQIDELLGEKATRSPAQQKIDSRLLYEIMRRSGDPAAGAAGLRSSIEVDPDGMTLVDLKAEVSDDLLARIEAMGGKVFSSFPQYRSIRAHLPIDQVETLAALPEVAFIQPAVRAITN